MLKIGIDFDRVLFDTDSFNEYLKQNVEGLHHVDTPPEDENGNYDPEVHAEMCGIDVEDIYAAVEGLSQFLFDDVGELERLEGEKVIVSRGRKEFQRKKIENSGADELVDDVIVVEEGSKDVAGIEFLIDDSPEEIDRAMIPGFVFSREDYGLKEVVERVNRLDG